MKTPFKIALISFFILFNSRNVFAESYVMTPADEELINTIQKQSFEYFIRERDKNTGLIADRAANKPGGGINAPASIAATGFGLTAYPIGVERGWLDYGTAFELTRRTLKFFLEDAPQERGFFYHFLKMDTGERYGKSELSPIDTALFLAGALFAAEYFDHPEIRNLASKLYERVDFEWMLNKGKTLALAWSPETGFNKRRWDHYDENMILYLLAIGSPTHPIPAESWQEIARPVGSYRGHKVIQIAPLFTHQYSHVWMDFRNKNDGYADYFLNSINATKANRAFCIDQSRKFSSYGPYSWGLTASDGPGGYRAYGAPPGWATHDGTVAPTGCSSSIVFTPKESIECMRHLYENLGDKLWGKYGFADAFNLNKKWVSPQVIGIDLGPMVAMIENYRSELVWTKMKQNVHLQNAMEKVGFREGSIEMPWPDPPVHKAPYVLGGITIDGYMKDWPSTEAIVLDKRFKDSGDFENDQDLMGEIRFAWDENALYFVVNVTDDDLIMRKTGKNIWMDDALEIYVDPDGDGLYWGNRKDIQLGFRAEEDSTEVVSWSWFKDEGDPGERRDVSAKAFVHEKGYLIEGAIRWTFLGIQPEVELTVRVSPSLHDIDRNRSEGKLSWFFRNEDEKDRFMLGKVILEKN